MSLVRSGDTDPSEVDRESRRRGREERDRESLGDGEREFTLGDKDRELDRDNLLLSLPGDRGLPRYLSERRLRGDRDLGDGERLDRRTGDRDRDRDLDLDLELLGDRRTRRRGGVLEREDEESRLERRGGERDLDEERSRYERRGERARSADRERRREARLRSTEGERREDRSRSTEGERRRFLGLSLSRPRPRPEGRHMSRSRRGGEARRARPLEEIR